MLMDATGLGQLVNVRAMEHCLHLAELHGLGLVGYGDRHRWGRWRIMP
jgi:LDH2 family malate/lactate/ureidoglycolate dehydrogenase